MAIVGLMIGRALLMVASLLSMALWVHKVNHRHLAFVDLARNGQ
jgi:hypothetical protein